LTGFFLFRLLSSSELFFIKFIEILSNCDKKDKSFRHLQYLLYLCTKQIENKDENR